MRTLVLKRSRGGFLATGIFISLAVAVFCWIFFVASKNPADSGESGILLLVFLIPWVGMLPHSWVGPGSALGCFLLNLFILYCVFGGLRFESRK